LNHKKNIISIFEKTILQLSPQKQLAIKLKKRKRIHSNLKNIIKHRLQSKKSLFYSLSSSLEAMSPLKVLSRGYSITKVLETNKIIKTPEQIKIGQDIITIVQIGEIISKVTDKKTKKI
jgi:exodeoxyribonuclease VII large subunit